MDRHLSTEEQDLLKHYNSLKNYAKRLREHGRLTEKDYKNLLDAGILLNSLKCGASTLFTENKGATDWIVNVSQEVFRSILGVAARAYIFLMILALSIPTIGRLPVKKR